MRASSTRLVGRQQPRDGQRPLDRSRRRIEPFDVGLRAEPRPLALRERLVATRVLGDRGLPRQLAVEDRPRLAVADRRERRQGGIEALAERPWPRRSGRRRTGRGRGSRSSRGASPRRPRARSRRRGRRSRAARAPRARRRRPSPSRAPGRRGAGWRCRSQLRVAGRPPAGARRAARGRPRGTPPPAGRGRQRRRAATRRAGRGRPRGGRDPCRRRGSRARRGRRSRPAPGPRGRAKSATRERLIGVDEVEPVMRDAPALGRRRLRGPDVEAAIDLPRVGRDDLGGDPLPHQALRDVDREPGLAGRRGAGDDEQRAAAAVTIRRAMPRSAYGPAWSIRAVTRRPTSSGPPARWTSLCSRLRPETRGPVGGRASVGGVLVVVAPRRRHGVDEDLDLAADLRPVPLEPDRLLDARAARSAARA